MKPDNAAPEVKLSKGIKGVWSAIEDSLMCKTWSVITLDGNKEGAISEIDWQGLDRTAR